MVETRSRAAELARLRPRLIRRAARLTGSPAEAEDLAQEALLNVWSRLAAGHAVADLDAYLWVTLRHLAARRRAGAVPPEETTALPDPSAPAEMRLFAREVVSAMSALPPQEARLLGLVALEGASYAEAARREGVPMGTVMSRLSRGRARLKARLKIDETTTP